MLNTCRVHGFRDRRKHRIIAERRLLWRGTTRKRLGLRKMFGAKGMAGQKPPPKLTTRLEVLVPEQLPRAIARAAERALMSQSEYARRALIDKLLAKDMLAV